MRLSPLAEFTLRQFARLSPSALKARGVTPVQAAIEWCSARAVALGRAGFLEKSLKHDEVAGELRQHLNEQNREPKP